MNIDQLSNYCLDSIKKYPKIEGQIKDFYILALDEIEQGGSETNECEIAYMSIEDEIKYIEL